MNKRSAILFIFLLIFWIAVSGVLNLQHILAGIFISFLVVWFWKDLNPKLPTNLYPKELLLFGRLLLVLVGYVIKSNITVAKLLLFSDLSSSSVFMELEPEIESEWGKVFLATCITITPGTITIDVNPKTNVFTIHALKLEIGTELYYWSMINEIRSLEKQVLQRRNDPCSG